MAWRASVGGTTHVFADLKTLLARATPPRSGDVLAGVAADSAVQRAAAQMALADLPLAHFLGDAIIPYEADAVTRLIVDGQGTFTPGACAPPRRTLDAAVSPSTIRLKRASTIAEIRKHPFSAQPFIHVGLDTNNTGAAYQRGRPDGRF